LLDPAGYPALQPLLDADGAHGIDLKVEADKTWSRIWAIRAKPGAQIVSGLITWWTPGQVEVVHLVTDPSARRQGHARRLMQALIDAAPSDASVWLEVRRSNTPARALYMALGFELSRERKSYYADGEDALELVRAAREGSER
jgi:ribosomal protein S18 acetylase RimI-like enzyme